MVIVPLDSSFEHKSSAEQSSAIDDLQSHSSDAGLRGTVVPVWEYGGRMKFIAPQPWHQFFRGLSLQMVYTNLNKEISW